jgi:acyl-CoA reductase-like NAD-dependent aldehyde dehydrogenase
VVLASEARPLPAVTLAEVLATSDLPGGVVNILTGSTTEMAPWLASHADVNALDLAGVLDPQTAAELEAEAAGTIKRVRRRPPDEDMSAIPDLSRMLDVLEIKTVWHPVGI